MMRLLAFLVAFLACTACHHDIKKFEAVDAVTADNTVTESVTTAPTERVTESWHFAARWPAGSESPKAPATATTQEPVRSTPPAGSSPAGFLPTAPGSGFAMELVEFQRVTEHLEPVAKTKTTENATASIKAASSEEEELDVGPGWKFYLAIGLGLGLVLLGAYAYLKFDWKTILGKLLGKVLP